MSLWDFFERKLRLKVTQSGISDFVEELQCFVKQVNTVLEEYLSWTQNDRKTSVIMAIESFLLSLQDLSGSIPQEELEVINALVPERLLLLYPTKKSPQIKCEPLIENEHEIKSDRHSSAEAVELLTCSNKCTKCKVIFSRKRHLQQHRCPQDWSRAQWVTLKINGKKKFVCAFKDCPTGLYAPEGLRQVWSKTSKVWMHFEACHATDKDRIHKCPERNCGMDEEIELPPDVAADEEATGGWRLRHPSSSSSFHILLPPPLPFPLPPPPPPPPSSSSSSPSSSSSSSPSSAGL